MAHKEIFPNAFVAEKVAAVLCAQEQHAQRVAAARLMQEQAAIAAAQLTHGQSAASHSESEASIEQQVGRPVANSCTDHPFFSQFSHFLFFSLLRSSSSVLGSIRCRRNFHRPE